ncbi:type III-B CRISPR-associated protein Cas10/Cmr2 [Schwartzia succinivorans]|jgi:CRISPR-associated protein Cmr2|uniref:CRISPR-associated protein Cmr2 n=1 Tax=Schwartzia succinivorans DSM 10502 TaxID=1123243 RepID=A0A1M4W9N6_9FIRM|nr:type III-B CRISPR-associated protein Cas10/Cmr2 [Schwartzia succinivorans]SHE77672.1 CRISPR-associated protein Cmr2 [Schwartzia succinivorans DSM 10502]
MIYHIGLTNGPILEVLQEAGSPAALWFASAFFSDFTARLCHSFKEKYGTGVDILSPYYEETGEDYISDGVGKYHDRVIMTLQSDKTKDELSAEIKELIRAVKRETIENFPKEEHGNEGAAHFLEKYIQSHFVLIPEDVWENIKKENVLLTLSPYLDKLELMRTMPDDDSGNLFNHFLPGQGSKQNPRLKNSGLFKRVSSANNQLYIKSAAEPEEENENETKPDSESAEVKSIRSIEDIAGSKRNDNGLKKYHYYAVVQADGDRVGKLLEKINENKDVKDFSHKCIDHAAAAAKMVGGFGGMTIYAGGEDLLFLAPVENAEGKTVFELCEELDEMFKEAMNKESTTPDNEKTSLSFGIAIQHKKFPLYEALQKAAYLLFCEAKQGPKNYMAVELQKHSGQTLGLRIPVPAHKVLREKYSEAKKKLEECKSGKNIETVGNSVIQTLSLNSRILAALDKAVKERISRNEDARQQLLDGWHNFQDNAGQAQLASYYEAVGNLYYDCFLEHGNQINVLDDMAAAGEDNDLIALLAYLKLNKFLIEQAGEEA